jgi:hypothetical protein
LKHIFPQDSSLDCWQKDFGTFSKEQKAVLLNSLGNLLLLSQSKNSSLQNDCFEKKKKQENGEKGYYNGSYSEIEVAQNDEWTPTNILNRGLQLLNFIDERYDLDLGTEENKIKLLHLEFLIDKLSNANAELPIETK